MSAVPLVNPVRTYAWGSHSVLPALLGEAAPAPEPWAEIWMGAHPGDPSRLPDGRSLADVEPGLPYLVKLLAAERPLSVQAHPGRERAAAGYAAEQARGVPVDAPERSYRDTSHKPELLVALDPVVALCGFRPVGEIARLVRLVDAPRLTALLGPLLDSGRDALRAVFVVLLRLRADGSGSAAALVAEVAAACGDVSGPGPDTATLDWVVRLAEHYPDDPGAVLPLVLRLLELSPGEGVFVAPGVLHAYLHGSGLEVQAASDNVLRGGLTPKHVDLDELVSVVLFSADHDVLVRPRRVADGIDAYDVPVDDFAVRRVRPADAPTGSVTVDDLAGPRLVASVDGHVSLGTLEVGPGRSAYLPAGEPLTVTGPGTCFAVGVPAAG